MKKSAFRELPWLLLLTVLVVLIWSFATDRLDPHNWTIPIQYASGDPLFQDAAVKSATEGDFIPLIKEGSPRLGAPYTSNWYDYATSGKFLVMVLALFMRLFGLGVANNLGMVLGFVSSALAFYFCCRVLKHDRIWSLAAAILYAFSYYTFSRLWGHLTLAYYYTVPLAMLSAWLVLASRTIKLGDKFSWICIITSLMMTQPYYLNMYCQFLCFALLAQFLGSRRRENIKVGIVALGVAVFGFLILNAGSILYSRAHGANQLATARNYFETELYALKPIEFFIPPPYHHNEMLASWGTLYKASAFVKGEIFSPYLGIVGIVGLVWVFVEVFIRLSRNGTKPRRFPSAAPEIVWIIIYATIGGLNCVLGIAGFQLFRGANRYSLFVLTIVMFFLVSRVSILSRKWGRLQTIGLAAFVVFIGLYDQLPTWLPYYESTVGEPSESDRALGAIPPPDARNERALLSDKAFGEKLEAKLPPGAMVFQIPVMGFPEGLPINGVSTYEMFRPYLWTKTLRFSYGAIRGRTREDWQYEVEKLPPAEMARQLEKYGFTALYLNRKAFRDGGEGILSQLGAAGRTEVIDDELHEQVCVLLKPSDHPELPHTDDRAQIIYAKGWSIIQNQPLQNQNWTSGDATIKFFSEPKEPAAYTMHCALASVVDRKVVLEMDGREIWSGQLSAGQGTPVEATLRASHGNNTIKIITDRPAAHPKESPYPIAVAVMGLRITKAGAQY